jgi:antirestriction protein ArdC
MKVYEIIAERTLGKLAEGTVPWRKPWQGGEVGTPQNLHTGHLYRRTARPRRWRREAGHDQAAHR